MTPLFFAYDTPIYQRLLPENIADIELFPKEIIDSFTAGGFTVKVTKGLNHAVASNEAQKWLLYDLHKHILKRQCFFFHIE